MYCKNFSFLVAGCKPQSLAHFTHPQCQALDFSSNCALVPGSQSVLPSSSYKISKKNKLLSIKWTNIAIYLKAENIVVIEILAKMIILRLSFSQKILLLFDLDIFQLL